MHHSALALGDGNNIFMLTGTRLLQQLEDNTRCCSNARDLKGCKLQELVVVVDAIKKGVDNHLGQQQVQVILVLEILLVMPRKAKLDQRIITMFSRRNEGG